MSFYHYRALLWKSFHLKLHHWLILILELLLPIGATVFVLWWSKILNSEMKSNSTVTIREDSRALKINSDKFKTILEYCYTPLNPATIAFMKKVEHDHNHSKFFISCTSVVSRWFLLLLF